MENTEEKKWCVYIHTSPSNKAYIGITSKDTEERWGHKGYHYKRNKHFWNAIQKYGWDNFEHNILFENLTKEEACKIEILLIALFDTQNPEYGYNISPGGDLGFTGCTLSDEAKQKISEANKGRLIGEKNHQYGVSPKERMDEDTYDHWLEQTRERVTSEEFREFMRQINVGKKYSDEVNAKKGRQGAEHPGARKVDQYTKDGVFIRRWDYAKLAAETLNINPSNIISCCRGTNGRKTAGGFIWKYASDETEEVLCA